MTKYTSRRAKRGQRPFGYYPAHDNPSLLLPDFRALELLEQAFRYLDEDKTYREVAMWLSKASGISISHTCLFRNYRKRLETMPRLTVKSSAASK
jgi:hypothetical protein